MSDTRKRGSTFITLDLHEAAAALVGLKASKRLLNMHRPRKERNELEQIQDDLAARLQTKLKKAGVEL